MTGNDNFFPFKIRLDLNYNFKLRIEDRTVKYLYMVADGGAEFNAEIVLKVQVLSICTLPLFLWW